MKVENTFQIYSIFYLQMLDKTDVLNHRKALDPVLTNTFLNVLTFFFQRSKQDWINMIFSFNTTPPLFTISYYYSFLKEIENILINKIP